MKFEKKKTLKVLKFFCLCTLMLMIWSKKLFYFWHTRIGHRPFGDVGPLGPLPLISSIFGPLLAFEGRVVQPLRVKIPVSNLCFSSHTRWHRPMGQCNTFVLKKKKMFLILRLFWALADLAVSSLGSQSLVIHLFFSNHRRRVQMMSKSKTRLLQSTTI